MQSAGNVRRRHLAEVVEQHAFTSLSRQCVLSYNASKGGGGSGAMAVVVNHHILYVGYAFNRDYSGIW